MIKGVWMADSPESDTKEGPATTTRHQNRLKFPRIRHAKGPDSSGGAISQAGTARVRTESGKNKEKEEQDRNCHASSRRCFGIPRTARHKHIGHVALEPRQADAAMVPGIGHAPSGILRR